MNVRAADDQHPRDELEAPPEGRIESSPVPPAPAPAPAATEATLPLVFHDRVLIVGTTGSGKSVLTEMLASELRTRVLAVDPKGELTSFGPRLSTRAVEQWLDTRPTAGQDFPRVVRWVPTSGEPAEFEPIYAAAHHHRGPLVVVTDELYGPGTAQTAPRSMRVYLTQGRGLKHGHIGLTQRPSNICMEARTEWNHLVVYSPAPEPADLRKIAAQASIDYDELAAGLDALPQFGFVWIDRRTREQLWSGPVPLETGRIL